MTKQLDLIDQRFGRLRVMRQGANNKRNRTTWECICDCGELTIAVGSELKAGHKTSCGCFRIDQLRAKLVTHGHAKVTGYSGTYKAWRAMLDRCSLGSAASLNYAQRGINVCESWMSFQNFLDDMSEKPAGMSLDRIDNNKGYAPDNCQWSDRKQQTRNRRLTLGCIHNGEWISIAEFADRYFLSYSAAFSRISSNGNCLRRGDQ